MILADFIRTHFEEIVGEWEAYAGSCLPAAKDLDPLRLRNHVIELLKFVADDMESPQTEAQQTEKSQGRALQNAEDSQAERHAVLRVADGFTIGQVVGEFRALRASVLRLSAKSGGADADPIEITRFNESIDQMLAESVARHTKLVADKLREAIRQKDRFIATLSHELRNPVSAISASTQILRNTEDPFIERIGGILARQVGHLTRLLEDLFEVARISSDRVTLKKARRDLRPCVLDAVDGNRGLIEEKGHQLTVDMPAEPVVMQIDCTRITQAIANLVNNAAKYSPPGSELSVVLKASTYEATIRVQDSGPGIRPDQLPHLFDAFYTNDPENPGKQGLGIGLWLASRMIDLHGGTLTAETLSGGVGVEFCIRLPLEGLTSDDSR